MNIQQRRSAMLAIMGLVVFGAFLFLWEQFQMTGFLIIVFCAGYTLRDSLEPTMREDE